MDLPANNFTQNTPAVTKHPVTWGIRTQILSVIYVTMHAIPKELLRVITPENAWKNFSKKRKLIKNHYECHQSTVPELKMIMSPCFHVQQVLKILHLKKKATLSVNIGLLVMSVTLKLNLFNIAKLNILSTKPTNTSTPLIKHNANNVIKHFTLITNW